MSTQARKQRRERERAASRLAEARERGLLDGHGSPLAVLVAIEQERERLADLEMGAVEQLRSVGTPWAVVGRALGITGQAAARRYRGLVPVVSGPAAPAGRRGVES